ncbi:hypothetical protein [Ferruginibacter profundus]
MKTDSLLLRGIRGKLGEIVVKHYGKKVVVTKAPDMSNIQPTAAQQLQRSRFARAVAHARHVNNTPELRQAYVDKAKKSMSVYQYVLKEYLKNNK